MGFFKAFQNRGSLEGGADAKAPSKRAIKRALKNVHPGDTVDVLHGRGALYTFVKLLGLDESFEDRIDRGFKVQEKKGKGYFGELLLRKDHIHNGEVTGGEELKPIFGFIADIRVVSKGDQEAA